MSEYDNHDEILEADEVVRTMLETDHMLEAEEVDEDNTMLEAEVNSDNSEEDNYDNVVDI